MNLHKQEGRYLIGSFSKLSNLSTKTLIWYDKIGILKPEYIDENNGYRYYGEKSLQKVLAIKYLQKLDFSLQEIKDFSADVLTQKIEELNLRNKIISSNIAFLAKLKDKMKVQEFDFPEIIGMSNDQIQGEWTYAGSSKSFDKIFDENLKRNSKMPYSLVFGDGVGAAGINACVYSSNEIIFDEKIKEQLKAPSGTTLCKDEKLDKTTFRYIILDNYLKKLIIFNKNEQKDKEIEYFVYYKFDKDDKKFSKQDILNILLRRCVVYSYSQKPDKSFYGRWVCVDNINSSQVENYHGERLAQDAPPYFMFSPLFDELEISKNGVLVLQNENVEINKLKITPENAIYPIYFEGDEFVVEDKHRHLQLKGLTKVIKGKKYLFVDIDHGIEGNYFVYRQI